MENIKEGIMIEIRDKIKKNPRYLNPMNKEFCDDIKRYG